MKITKHIKNILERIYTSITQKQEQTKEADTDRQQTKQQDRIKEIQEKLEEEKQQLKEDIDQIYKN